MSLKKQNTKVHISGKKNRGSQDKLETNTTREKHIADALATYDEKNPKRGAIPIATRRYTPS